MIWKLFEIFLKFLPTIHDFQKLRALARTNSHSREYDFETENRTHIFLALVNMNSDLKVSWYQYNII